MCERPKLGGVLSSRVSKRTARRVLLCGLAVLIVGGYETASAMPKAVLQETSQLEQPTALPSVPSSEGGSNNPSGSAPSGTTEMDALLKSIMAVTQLPPTSSGPEDGTTPSGVVDLQPLLRLVMSLLESPDTGGQADFGSLLQLLGPLPERDAAAERSSLLSTPSTVLGLNADAMTPELREFFGADKDVGVLVVAVEHDSIAMDAGLLVGDVVVSVDGNRIARPNSLHTIAEAILDSGNAVTLSVVRDHVERAILIER